MARDRAKDNGRVFKGMGDALGWQRINPSHPGVSRPDFARVKGDGPSKGAKASFVPGAGHVKVRNDVNSEGAEGIKSKGEK